jgi:cytochrome c-type biogenesis protein CcmF
MLLAIAGIVGSSVFGTKSDLQLTPGQSVQIAGQTLKFQELREDRHANYGAVEATMLLTSAEGKVTTLSPQRRFYDKSEQPNSQVALQSGFKRDVYLTLAGWENDGNKPTTVAIQAYVNPLVSWIWTGGIVMVAGALLGLLPRLIPIDIESEKPVVEKAAKGVNLRGLQLQRSVS